MSDFNNERLYYNISNILSYNKLLNFIIGGRGGGKSYSAKQLAINNWLKHNKQFVYLRRYNTEFNNIVNYFGDIKDRYPDHTFEVKAGNFIIDGEIAGYYMPLSTSMINKSNSYNSVSLIIFDEFIIDQGVYHYLKDEVTTFLDLFETIARTRDDVKAILISNSISSINPYFVYFNIVPKINDKFIVRGETVTHIYKNIEFMEFKRQTKFGKLIDGSKYGDYNIKNEWLRDNKTFIEKMQGKAYCWYTIRYLEKDYSVWYSVDQGLVFISTKKAPENTQKYAITTNDQQANMILLSKKNVIFKKLIEAYNFSQIRFDSLASKSAFLNFSNLII